MKTLSLKLEDQLFSETETLIAKVKKSRNRYINEAVAFYNQLNNRKLLEHQLAKESKLVRKESMKVLAEFEALDHEDEAI